MKISFQSVLKYLFFLGVAALLLFYVYRNQQWSEIQANLAKANFFWIGVSVASAVMSHVSRALRWKIALRPFGFQVSGFRAFLAVFIGYFANLFVPRMGEVARCGILRKTDQVPVVASFGAVITERVFDLFILMTLTATVVLLEFDKVGAFLLQRLALGSETLPSYLLPALLGVSLLGLLLLSLLYSQRKRIQQLPFYHKIADFIIGLKEGLLSVTKLTRRERAWYLLHTAVIWIMYYTMTYVLFFTQAETSDLGMLCALSVFIMGGIGIVIPTPGGVGSYHLFVGVTLMAYGLGETESKAFAFLMHSAQSLAILFFGGLSLLIISLWLPRLSAAQQAAQNPPTEPLPHA